MGGRQTREAPVEEKAGVARRNVEREITVGGILLLVVQTGFETNNANPSSPEL
jgi:hypothetical protein